MRSKEKFGFLLFVVGYGLFEKKHVLPVMEQAFFTLMDAHQLAAFAVTVVGRLSSTCKEVVLFCSQDFGGNMILKCPNCDEALCLMVTLTFVGVQAKGVIDDEGGFAYFAYEDTGIRAGSKVESIYCPNPDCDWTFGDPWEFLNLEVKNA